MCVCVSVVVHVICGIKKEKVKEEDLQFNSYLKKHRDTVCLLLNGHRHLEVGLAAHSGDGEAHSLLIATTPPAVRVGYDRFLPCHLLQGTETRGRILLRWLSLPLLRFPCYPFSRFLFFPAPRLTNSTIRLSPVASRG